MKSTYSMMIFGLGLMSSMVLIPVLIAQERIPQQPSGTGMAPLSVAQATAQPSADSRMPVYRPPLRGAPESRVGGASRGIEDDMLILNILAPQQTGLTISEQPSLYWYISKAVTTPVELTVIDDQAIHPLLQVHLDAPKGPGVQRFQLSDQKISLQPDVEYQWFVALVPDPDERSKDILAGGTIQRVMPSQALLAKLNRAGKQEHPSIYAEEGLWYDAIAALSELIDANPNDTGLRAQRAALLEQVDLPEVAAYDRGDRGFAVKDLSK